MTDLETFASVARLNGWSAEERYRVLVCGLTRELGRLDANRLRDVTRRAPPKSDTRWDAVIAAGVEHALSATGGDLPEWIEEPGRFVRGGWVPQRQVHPHRVQTLLEAPCAYARHGVPVHPRDTTPAEHMGKGHGVEDGPTFGRRRLRRLLATLSERLRRREATARLYVVGGACIALAYKAEQRTRDVDVRIDEGHLALLECVEEIARERALPKDWLNEAVRNEIPDATDRNAPTLYDSPWLKVTGASPEHLLAMKLEAGRPRDVDDIRLLRTLSGNESVENACAVHRRLLPRSKRQAEVRSLLLALEEEDGKHSEEEPTAREREWRAAASSEAYPKYDRVEERDGLSLLRRRTPDAEPEVLGRGLTVRQLARIECAYREWPEDAVPVVLAVTTLALARARERRR